MFNFIRHSVTANKQSNKKKQTNKTRKPSSGDSETNSFNLRLAKPETAPHLELRLSMNFVKNPWTGQASNPCNNIGIHLAEMKYSSVSSLAIRSTLPNTAFTARTNDFFEKQVDFKMHGGR